MLLKNLLQFCSSLIHKLVNKFTILDVYNNMKLVANATRAIPSAIAPWPATQSSPTL
jgi:hypothetical protein